MAAVAVLRRVRVDMRPEGVFAFEGSGVGGGPGSCVELPEEGVGWATEVAVCGASGEPKPSLMGTPKTKAKAMSAAGRFSPRPGR